MPRVIIILLLLTVTGRGATAQEELVGPASVGSGEPLFSYDDLERWKHGYLQVMPYYGGYHSFRPYNYKQVISQSQTAAGWGLAPTMPYSQQFWHYYEQQADLAAPPVLSSGAVPAQPAIEIVPQPMNGQTKSAPPTFNTPQFAAPLQVSGPQFGTPDVASPAGVSRATFQQPEFSTPQFQTPAPRSTRPAGTLQTQRRGR